MGLMFMTVIGYTVCLGLVGTSLMYFLTKTFDSSEAIKIDPRPDNDF